MRTTVVAPTPPAAVVYASPKYVTHSRIGGSLLYDVFAGTMVAADGHHREVSLMRMRPSCASNRRFADLFAREAKRAAVTRHPNLVAAIDLDRDATGHLSVVLEPLAGKSLAQLSELGPMPATIAVQIIAGVLAGLGHLHQLTCDGRVIGTVHGELSPRRILVQWDGSVKVTDFSFVGPGQREEPGADDGREAYASPEKAAGLPLDARSDLYAVGMMLHQLVTGRTPNLGRTVHVGPGALSAVPSRTPQPPAPPVSPHLRSVMRRMLATDRASRYDDCEAALAELRATAAATARDLSAFVAARFPGDVPPYASASVGAATYVGGSCAAQPPGGTGLEVATSEPPGPRTVLLAVPSVVRARAVRASPYRWLIVVAIVAALLGAGAALLKLRATSTRIAPALQTQRAAPTAAVTPARARAVCRVSPRDTPRSEDRHTCAA